MPNRIIKESICTSDSLNKLSDFEENLFYKLIVNCDDYGRFDARPAILKSRCYPLRERLTLKHIEDALQVLARVGCVELYYVDGKPFLHLPAWEVHQQVRAKKSKFPAPDSNGNQMISDDCICPRNPIQSESESLSVYPPNPPAGGNGSDAPARSSKKAAEKAAVREIWERYQFSPALEKAVKTWGEYKSERNERYQPTGLNSVLSQIKKHADAHGDEAVIGLIEYCMSNNWKGIIWDKLGQKVTASGGTARRVEKSVRPVAPAGNAEWDAVARLLQAESEDTT